MTGAAFFSSRSFRLFIVRTALSYTAMNIFLGRSCMSNFLHTLHEFVWSPGMLFFFLATGIRFTIKSRFFQITHAKEWFSTTLGSLLKKEEVRKQKRSIPSPSSSLSALRWRQLWEPEISQGWQLRSWPADPALYFGCGFPHSLE